MGCLVQFLTHFLTAMGTSSSFSLKDLIGDRYLESPLQGVEHWSWGRVSTAQFLYLWDYTRGLETYCGAVPFTKLASDFFSWSSFSETCCRCSSFCCPLHDSCPCHGWDAPMASIRPTGRPVSALIRSCRLWEELIFIMYFLKIFFGEK